MTENLLVDTPLWPAIEPVNEGIARPLWSVMIPAYNCAAFLEKALQKVLEEDESPEIMQIEVIDDVSTKDNPEEVVRKIGKGRVGFFRQERNVGPPANFNTCLRRSTGRLIHILHGDDMIEKGFYSRLGEAFKRAPSIGAAFCRSVFIDGNDRKIFISDLERTTPGIIPNWLERISIMCWPQASSVAVKRNVYERIGGFCEELEHTNDWDMWKRIALHYPVWFEPAALAYYRYLHPSSHSYNLVSSGANIKDSVKSISISDSYLPPFFARKVEKRSRLAHALYASKMAARMLLKRRVKVAASQFREAIMCADSIELKIKLFNKFILDLICYPFKTLKVKLFFLTQKDKRFLK